MAEQQPSQRDPQGEAPSAIDEADLHKGRGRMLAGMIVAGVAALTALALYMGSGGNEAYSKFGKNINGFDQKYFDQFWGCAFPDYDTNRIENNEDLQNQIHGRARDHGATYGAHVRDDCLPKLAELEEKLQTLIPPDGMKEPVRNLVDAVSRLRGGWSDFIAHLDGLEGAYERSAANGQVRTIAKAWYDYKKTFSKANKDLEKKLGTN